MTPQEILNAAADHIEEYGWQRGGYGQKEEPCCVLGALSVAAASNGASLREAQAGFYSTRDIVKDQTGVRSVADWNDVIAQDAEEVVAMLRKAATV